MKNTSIAAIKQLLETQQIASLGTLSDQKEPFVSMVPFALDIGTRDFVIHVSQLAAHTQWMLAHPKISLMVMANRTPDKTPQEIPRLTIQGTARKIDKNSLEYEISKTIYIKRFPQSSELFSFADFFIFKIKPATIRWIAGFAQARTIPLEELFLQFN